MGLWQAIPFFSLRLVLDFLQVNTLLLYSFPWQQYPQQFGSLIRMASLGSARFINVYRVWVGE
jgi:hypothetical protein